MLTKEHFSCLAQKYIDTVFRVAFSWLKSRPEADDVTQTVFLKLCRADKPFESDDHIKHWLIRVTVNECKKQLISPWRRQEPIEDYANTLSFTAPEHSELFYAVMGLPKKYRIPVFLYYYEDYSTQEIADILSIPRATVATHLKRARDMLKTILQEAKDDVY